MRIWVGVCSRNVWHCLDTANVAVHEQWWPTSRVTRRSSSMVLQKNERANISSRQLKAMRLLAAELLGYTTPVLCMAIKDGELIEVHEDD